MHVVLTGEKQAGKSTLVRLILSKLKEIGVPFSGLKTFSEFDGGDRIVYMSGISSNWNALDTSKQKNVAGKAEVSAQFEDFTPPSSPAKYRVGVCRHMHQIEKNPEVFDKYGTAFLKNPEKTVIIDEVGNMEKDAALYSAEIMRLLRRNDLSVLLVLQKMANTRLANYIRENFNLIEITKENRDSVCPVIIKTLTNVPAV